MTQRTVAGEPSTLHSGGSRPAQLAATSLDRMLDRAHRAAPQLSRASDMLLVGVCALLAFADVAVWATDPVVDTGRLSISIAALVPCLGVLATITLALRRRHLAAALVTLASSGIVLTVASWTVSTSLPPSFAALFALAVMASVALRRQPSRSAIALAVLAALAVAAESLRPMVSTAAYLLVLFEGAFAVAGGVGVYLRWSDWRRVAAADAARADERLDIAREMHDMVGHYVTAMVVQAQAARHVAEHQPAAATVALERIESAGTAALAAMHRMVGGLRNDSPTAPIGTWDDIDRMIADAVAQGLPVRFTIDEGVRGTAGALALLPSVHRIIAESLTNVRRHGHGVTCIHVAVTQCGDHLVTTVHNDGAAAQPPGSDTFGIVGMSERATSLGGSLSAGPAPDGGWIVRADLPVRYPR
ncbi:MAG: histidine kinase [Aquihabitans sp.]